MTDTNDSVISALAAIHSAANARHDRSRNELLGRINVEPRAELPPRRFTLRRYVLGGASAGLAAAVLGILWAFAPPSPAKAMERLAQALSRVDAYTYRMEMVYVSRKDEGRTVKQIISGSWRTKPPALEAMMQIYDTLDTNTVYPSLTKTVVDLQESHETGRPGILIDHLKREYWFVHESLTASSIPPGSPQVAVHMVQQRRGRVVRDLGEKEVGGQMARGLEIVLDNAQPVSELGATVSEIENGVSDMDWRNTSFAVWIDPNTDLPIEFSCSRRGVDFETTYRFADFSWNPAFGEGEFDLPIPSGYTERKISVDKQ